MKLKLFSVDKNKFRIVRQHKDTDPVICDLDSNVAWKLNFIL